MGCLYICNDDMNGGADPSDENYYDYETTCAKDDDGLPTEGWPYSRDSDYFATREDCQRYIDQFE